MKIVILEKGYIIIKRNKKGWSTTEVGVQMKNEELICFIAKIFEKLYGKPHIWKDKKGLKVCYTNCNIIRELIIDDHFLEHNDRRKKLIKGYFMNKFGKSDIKYLSMLQNNKSFRELAKLLNIGIVSTYQKLERMVKLGLVTKEKINKRFSYSLTNKGKYFLNCLSSVSE